MDTILKKLDEFAIRESTGEVIPKWEYAEVERFTLVKNATETIIGATNIMSRNTNDLATIMVEAIEKDHRTLQQSTLAVLLQTLLLYADAPYDGRNEYSVKICGKIRDYLKAEGVYFDSKVYFPTI